MNISPRIAVPELGRIKSRAQAPSIKDNFFTVLSTRDCAPEVRALLDSDPVLSGCFV
jgi:hypothetical protein